MSYRLTIVILTPDEPPNGVSALYLLSALILYYSFHIQRRKSSPHLFTTANAFKAQNSVSKKFETLFKYKSFLFFLFLVPASIHRYPTNNTYQPGGTTVLHRYTMQGALFFKLKEK